MVGRWRGGGARLLPAVLLADLGLERGPTSERGLVALALVAVTMAVAAVVVAVIGQQRRAGPTTGAGRRALVRVWSIGGGVVQVAAGVLLVVGSTALIRQLPVDPAPPPGWRMIRPPHEVAALAVQDEVVWAGGRDGLVAIDRASGAVRPALPAQPAFRSVRGLLVDRSHQLWVAHGGGLTRYRAGQWSTFTPDDGWPPGAGLALLEDRDGHLWIGREQGLLRYDGRRFQPVTLPDGLESELDTLLQDSDGTIWCGSSAPGRGGLASFDGRAWRRYTVQDGLAHSSVNGIIQTRQGALWVATGFGNRGGASRLVAGAWTTVTRQDGLAGDKVRSIFEDRAGRLWFGSEYDGIVVFDGAGWRRLTPHDGLAGWEVKAMAQDADGALWLGTENGVNRILDFPDNQPQSP